MNANVPVGVIGSGAMGVGIAQVAAEAGHTVMLYDNNPDALGRAQSSLIYLFAGLVSKGKRTQEEATATLTRITFATEVMSLANCGLVIEAIVEDLALKRRLFAELDEFCATDCLLATNTSSLSVTAIAAATRHPERVLGLHFFNPAPLMQLVELVPAAQSAADLLDRARGILSGWGKICVEARDTPGFIVNRVARPYYSEALRIYEEGLASPAEIDAAMEAIGFRMGPFHLMDFIGHDVNFRVTEHLFHAFWGEARYRPSFAQQRLLDAGYLGKKSGRGFYSFHESGQPQREVSRLSPKQATAIQDRMLALLINEAADALHFGIASASDIDRAVQLGVKYPKGLLAWGAEIGHTKVVERLDQLFHYYHEERYRASAGLRKLAGQEL